MSEMRFLRSLIADVRGSCPRVYRHESAALRATYAARLSSNLDKGERRKLGRDYRLAKIARLAQIKDEHPDFYQ